MEQQLKQGTWVLTALSVAAAMGACNLSTDVKDDVTVPPPGGATIRVLAAYTADAWEAVRQSGQDPTAHAAYRTETTNLVLSNSGVSHRVELADAVEMSTTEANIYGTPDCAPANVPDGVNCAAEWFANALESAGSEPATLRALAGADIAILLMTSGQDGKLSGSARGVPTHAAPYERASASIETGNVLGFAHEIGHVLGAGHDRYARDEPVTAGIDYGQTFSQLTTRTLMAYADECDALLGDGACTQVAWFTNPLVDFHGQALGNASSEYNACVVEYYGATVSNYYEMTTGSVAYSPPAPITACPFTLLDTYTVGGDLCEADYNLATDADLATIANCGTVRGDLTISGSVTSLTALSQLVHVEGDLEIEATAVTSLDGLQALTTVETLTIESPITSLNTLSALTHMDDLELEGAPLTDLSGLEALVALQSVTLTDCDALTSLSGLPELAGLDTLRIDDCDALHDLTSIQQVRGIGFLRLERNDQLHTLSSPGWLDSLQRLIINDNASLTSLDGLESIDVLVGELSLSDNPALVDIGALASVVRSSTLFIDNLDALTDLSGLAALETVDAEVSITNNDALTSLGGLSALTTASSVWVADNPLLTSCDLPNLMPGVYVYCDANP